MFKNNNCIVSMEYYIHIKEIVLLLFINKQKLLCNRTVD